MRKLFKTTLCLLLCLSMLTGCATSSGGGGRLSACSVLGPKTAMGIAAGAAAGAGLGAVTNSNNRGEAALIGALVGGIVGGIAGASMDASDCKQAKVALQSIEKAKTGKTIVWKNPETGNSGTLKPTGKITKTASGTCRPFETSRTTADGTAYSKGTTCRDENGDWYVVG